MSYLVQSSERTRKSGAEGETKALLYLMNFRADSDQIHYFVVDFFNDLTGMDRFAEKLWDVQSKYNKNSSPKEIGKELVTLFKNFLSDFDFSYYILFLGGVTSTLRVDSTKSSFSISNLKPAALNNVILGLKEEALEKTYISNENVTDKNISEFLKNVIFVVDDKEPREYIREIIKKHPRIIPNNKVLDSIFNELRDEQANKKNTLVEGITIETTEEALNYCRHLTSNEIRLFVLERILNRNPLEKGVPISFLPIYSKWLPEKQKDMLDDCKRTLCLALFNKNAAAGFWNLFECIYNIILINPTFSVQKVYNEIGNDLKNGAPDFDVLSLKYFISIVKDGIQDDN